MNLFRRATAAILFAVLVSPLSFGASQDSQNVSVQPLKIFAPVGYDNNDNVEVVLDGTLPNTCYHLSPVSIQKDLTSNRIHLLITAKVASENCQPMEIRYSVPVELGRLPVGEYLITTEDEAVQATLTVTKASNLLSDNFIYAAIDSAEVTKTANGQWIANLRGRYPDTCLTMGEVRVINSGDTIEVLPILKVSLGDHSQICTVAEDPFSYQVVLPAMTKGRHLLHIRSLNGHSINFTFTVSD